MILIILYLCKSNLKTNGDDIWYGILATHTLKKGNSDFRTSPTLICSLFWYGVFIIRFFNSATNLQNGIISLFI